jgi:antitoxin CcdA
MKSTAAVVRRRVNLTVREDYLEQAKRAGVNLSRVLEESLEQRLREQRAQTWLEENREAIEQYNDYIRRYGVWSKSLRRF